MADLEKVHNRTVATHVVRNPKVVIAAESLNEAFTSSIFKSVPLSNRINIKTRLLKSEPNLPNDAGWIKWNIGPINMPISISPNTSGIPFLSNRPAK